MPALAPELFDVVDQHDCVVRRETRHEVHRQRLLHRAVHILLFNTRGEVYLQRRSPGKDTFPNRWTTSCSGHVDAGEDYDIAAQRELAEELGLNFPDIIGYTSRLASPATSDAPTLQPFIKHPPCRETGWEFIWIYSLTTDVAPRPDPAEISDGLWLTPEDLTRRIAMEPNSFTPSMRLVWRLWREESWGGYNAHLFAAMHQTWQYWRGRKVS
jgi:isopentenyl-diphosphate delta-isomerase type 1